jgi:hypothetical protein
MTDEPKMTFMCFEWPGFPKVEMRGSGALLLDDKMCSKEEFVAVLRQIAMEWQRGQEEAVKEQEERVKAAKEEGRLTLHYSPTYVTGVHVRGPVIGPFGMG